MKLKKQRSMMASLRWRCKLMTKASKCTKDLSRHASSIIHCFIGPYVQYVFNHIQQQKKPTKIIILYYTALVYLVDSLHDRSSSKHADILQLSLLRVRLCRSAGLAQMPVIHHYQAQPMRSHLIPTLSLQAVC